jgi:hypothetical protein
VLEEDAIIIQIQVFSLPEPQLVLEKDKQGKQTLRWLNSDELLKRKDEFEKKDRARWLKLTT